MIAGSFTLAECDDFITLATKKFTELANTFYPVQFAWKAADPTVEAAWENELQSRLLRFKDARDAVNNATTAFLPRNMVPDQAMYDALTAAVVGDGTNLLDRLIAANGGAFQITKAYATNEGKEDAAAAKEARSLDHPTPPEQPSYVKLYLALGGALAALFGATYVRSVWK